MLCENCRRERAYWAAVPKRDRHADSEPAPLALCDPCYRQLRTVAGVISSARLITETADPSKWGA